MATTRLRCLVLIVCACSLPAWGQATAAPGIGDVVAEIDTASYRNILDNLLETHIGDSRGQPLLTTVPEPASMLILAAVGLLAIARRRYRLGTGNSPER